MYRVAVAITTLSISFGCCFCQSHAFGAMSPNDPASYSRPELVTIKHLDWNLTVNFDEKVLSGTAVLHFETFENISEVILDVRDINLDSIKLENNESLTYTVDDHVPQIGSKLTIALPKSIPSGQKFKIIIDYATSPSASALQWLEPQQTIGKKYPYLFSQVSPIHARSIVPCQDTAAVKFTYSARVRAPPPFTALMSALPEGHADRRFAFRQPPIHARSIVPCQDTAAVKFTYSARVRAPPPFTALMSALPEGHADRRFAFRQPVPIPTNLLAIAVAVLEERSIGPRSKVWSEKETVDQAAWEFAETEQYLAAAERLCGKYDWTQYDVLVLPPSFPYGAMENPCLTFTTPTLLAGDRSQANVIIHEIAHSWTGNLVSIRNFEHFWLKEGWTVFLERKIRASLIQDPVQAKINRDFDSLMGLEELTSEIVYDEEQGRSHLTSLVVNLTGVHPEDTYSIVPYEKGSLFLRYLEDLIGVEPFENFTRSYITHFAGKSLDTDQFRTYLVNHFKETHEDKLAEVDWEKWLYGQGMPPVIPKYDTTLGDAVYQLMPKILEPNYTFAYDDVKNFTTYQMIHLLQKLLDGQSLSPEKLMKMGSAYKISDSHNSEIKMRWLRLRIKTRDQSTLADVFEYVNSIGRVKYVRPIYRDLYVWEEVRPLAIENFIKNEPNMMHITAHSLRQELHLNN